jgi:uncharacterized protein YidB (DUF937 family)
MSLLDGVLGGLLGAGATAMVTKVLEQHGGVQGLVSQFEKTGFGSIVQSWVGKGANQPIQANQIQQALGADTLKNLAQKVGLSEQDLSAKLANILPDAVDKLTPEGRVAEAA